MEEIKQLCIDNNLDFYCGYLKYNVIEFRFYDGEKCFRRTGRIPVNIMISEFKKDINEYINKKNEEDKKQID